MQTNSSSSPADNKTIASKKAKLNLSFEKIKNYFNPSFIDINGQKVTKKFPWIKLISFIFTPIILILLIVWMKPDFQLFKPFINSLRHFFDINKNIKIGAQEITPLYTFKWSLELLWKTVVYSILGTFFGIIIAIPVSLLCSKNFIKSPWIYNPIRMFMSVIRAFPPLVLAYVLFLIVSKDLAATIAIALFVCSIMTKWLYEDLDTYDVSSYYSAQSIGNTKTIAFKNTIFPYLVKRIVSYGFYSFEMVVRFAAILGVVGISTIGWLLNQFTNIPENFSHASIVIWVLVSFMVLLEVLNFVIKKYLLEKNPKRAKLDTSKPLNNQIEEIKKQKPKDWIAKIIIGVIILALIIVAMIQIDWGIANSTKQRFFDQGIKNLFVDIEWSLFFKWDTGDNPIQLGFDALALAVLSSMIGLLFALIFGLLASKNIVSAWIAYPFKLFIILIRAIPVFTFGFLFLILSKDSILFAGTLALGIHSIGMLGKLINEAIEKIPKHVFDSLNSLGLIWWQKIRLGVFKQIMPYAISNFLYRIELNFKSTVELGVVGACPFGFQMTVYSQDYQQWGRLMPYLIVTLIILLVLEQISNLFRKRLLQGYWLSQENWIFKKIAEWKLINALSIAKSNHISFTNSQKWADYALAKSKFLALTTLIYNQNNPGTVITNEIYNDLNASRKLYLTSVQQYKKQINQEIKSLRKNSYLNAFNESAKHINKLLIIKRHKIAKKSTYYAVQKYFDSFVEC